MTTPGAFDNLPDWQSVGVGVCIGGVTVICTLMIANRTQILPPFSELALIIVGSCLWVAARTTMNQLSFVDWMHSRPANTAVEVAFIVYMFSKSRNWPETFLVNLTILPYAFYSVFCLFSREYKSSIVVSFSFGLFFCQVIGWWVDGLRRRDQSDLGEHQTTTGTHTLESAQETNR